MMKRCESAALPRSCHAPPWSSAAPPRISAAVPGCVRAIRSLILLLLLVAPAAWGEAPDIEFQPPAAAEDAATAAIMRDLAARLVPVYEEPDPDRYLANLSVLQMAALDYTAADASRISLRERRRSTEAGLPVGRGIIYDMYARARAMEADNRAPFADNFATTFRERVSGLDDKDAYTVMRWLETPLGDLRDALQTALEGLRNKERIDQSEAVELIRSYVSYDAYRSFNPLIAALAAEDDNRRYITDAAEVRTADGAKISAVMVRPKAGAAALPALFEFALAGSRNDAKECAAHGYAGVVAYARWSRDSPDRIFPFEHDGSDARAVITWIARQPWSDGRVGMYGDGFGASTAWAAAKRPPAALKAIATSGAMVPGISFPMRGGIFHNSAYRWSLRDSAAAESGAEAEARWSALDQAWYRSGRRYREFGRIVGKPNPTFIRWLNHPSYDRYWQKLTPYREQFSDLRIPILTISGYYSGSQSGDLYLFSQHLRLNPHANHTLIVGPYDDGGLEQGPGPLLLGLQIDPAALADLRELRYQWFDHVLNAAPAPALLQDNVNFEVMGANEWRHAPSLEAMAEQPLRLYLDADAADAPSTGGAPSAFPAAGAASATTSGGVPTAASTGGAADATGTAGTIGAPSSGGAPNAPDAAYPIHLLTQRRSAKSAFVQQTLSLADREDAGWSPSAALVSQSLEPPPDGAMFVSEPFTAPTEFNGLFSGRLDFRVNKMDMDLNMTLYEQRPDGDYVRLFAPGYEFRASYVRDRVHRRLLKAGERQELTFTSERITSRLLQKGSRLVLVIRINKRPDREINYGSGKDVSDESVADGRIPIKVRWYNDSYVEIPVRGRPADGP